MEQVQKRRFGRTGLQVPEVTYGGGWVGGSMKLGAQESPICGCATLAFGG